MAVKRPGHPRRVPLALSDARPARLTLQVTSKPTDDRNAVLFTVRFWRRDCWHAKFNT